MNKYLELLFRKPKKNDVLTQMRRRILKTMLTGSFWIGTALFLIALIPVVQRDLHVTILVYSILYAWIILIAFLPHLPYRVRAIGWLGLFYVIGIINLFMSGFNVDAGLFFITFITMAILLLDLPGGVVALALCILALSISGFVNVSQSIHLLMGLPQSDPLLWIIGGIIFLLMGGLVNYSLTKVMYGLDDNLAKANYLSEELEQKNRSLQMSEARYRTLVETSPGLVVLLNLEGNILMANQVGLRLFGYENQEDVIGKNMLVFIASEDKVRVADSFQKTIQGGPPNDLECLALRKDGSQFYAEFNAALVRDEAGEPQAVIGIGKDVSERKESEQILQEAKDLLAKKVLETSVQLERTSNRLEELVKHGPAVIFSYRASDHAFNYISENVADLLGYEANSIIGDPNFWRSHLHPEDLKSVVPLMDLTGSPGRSTFEYRFLKKDGTYRWLRGERVLLRDAQGNPTEYIGSWSDITERKKNEESLRFFQDSYRSLYESMMDAYASVDMDGRIQQFNWAFLQMLGHSSEELHKLTYQDLTPEKWHDMEAGIIQKQVIPRGYSETYEKEYIRKDGTIFPVELRTVLLRDGVGNPSGMWAIIRDISQRKAIEQSLRESEERYRVLLENSQQGVIVLKDMRIIYVNKAVTEFLGYSQAELEALTPLDFTMMIHPDDRPIFQQRLEQQLMSGPGTERDSLRVLHKDGQTHWLEIQTMPIQLQGKLASLVSFIDVTDIKQAQAKLEENAMVRQAIIDASNAFVLLVDKNGNVIASNDKFAKRVGMNTDRMIGLSLFDLPHDDTLTARQRQIEQVFSSGKPVTFTDSRRGAWFEINLYPIVDASGNVASIAVYAQDVTKQRQLTESLKASEEQYRTLAEAAQDAIFIIGRDGILQYINTFGAKLVDKEPLEIVGQSWKELFSPEAFKRRENNLLHAFQTGEMISMESSLEVTKGLVWLSARLVPMKDTSGKVIAVLGVSRDITERKKIEEALQQARDQLEERVRERTRELSESQNQLRLLTAQTITLQEEERRSISRDLHDEAGQALVILKFGLAGMQNDLPEGEALFRKRLSDSIQIVDQTMTHIRALAHSLRPPVMEVGGIHMSLQEYCHEMSDRAQIPILYQGVDIPGLPYEIGISLFRFVQEGLTNIMKHSQATKVKVRLQYRKREISLSVSDNGRGIEEKTQSDGLGILGIRERLTLLGGRLEIRSQKGQGVQLVGHVPWANPGKL